MMKVSKYPFVLGTALIGAIVLPLPSYAMKTGHPGDVSIAGKRIFTIRTEDGGMNVLTREGAVTERINKALANPHLKASDFEVSQTGSQGSEIVYKDHLIVTITNKEATANHSTPSALAKVWLGRIRHILPKSSVKPQHHHR